jgi:sec-independent protein translocase protein TatA
MSLGHWIVVLLIVLVLFGAGRLSDIGKGLGEGIKNFKKGLKDDDGDDGVRVAEKRKAPRVEDDEPKQLAEAPAAKKKTIQIEIGEDDDEEEILRKLAAKKAARKAAESD